MGSSLIGACMYGNGSGRVCMEMDRGVYVRKWIGACMYGNGNTYGDGGDVLAVSENRGLLNLFGMTNCS